MPSTPTATPPSIAPLLALLATVRSRTRRWIWVESAATLVLAATGMFWVSLLVDRLVEPPAWMRGCAVGGAIAALGWIVRSRLVGRLTVPLPDDSLALLVERAHPEMGDSLSTAITLAARAAAGGVPEPVDVGLSGLTIGRACELAGTVRPEAIFRRGRLRRGVAAAVAAAASIAALALFRPDLTGVWGRRIFGLADEPWPRRVVLEVAGFPNGTRTVARGSDVEVLVVVRSRTTIPELVELRTRSPRGTTTARMGTRGGATADGQPFGHVIEDVVEPLELDVRAGDARTAGLRLLVEDAPTVAAVEIVYTPPDYLGGVSRRAAASRLVPVPRGSRVVVTCTSSKPLAEATLAVRTSADRGDERRSGVETTLAGVSWEAGGRTISGTIAALDGDAAVVATFVDTAGLANRDPVPVLLAAVADEPPRLDLRLIGVSTAVTPQATLGISGTIADDHGLTDAALQLTSGDRASAVPLDDLQPGVTLVDLPADSPASVPLGPLGLVVGGRLEIHAVAHDACGLAGGPNEGRSDAWTLDVVTADALRGMLEAREIVLRRRYQAAVDDLATARDSLDVESDAGAASAGPCAAAAGRAAGETAEIAEQFRAIRLELAANGLLTPETEARLVGRIADPLDALAVGALPALARECRTTTTGSAALVTRADEVLKAMRAVLDRMLELESFNELIERLRHLLREQEALRGETLQQQRQRGRAALESP